MTRRWITVATSGFESFYNQKRASSELRRYRAKGPIPSTGALIDALKAEGIRGASLLDVGGGIGAIQHELLDAGVATVVSVEAASAYIQASREEARRRSLEHRVTYWHGDFVELADSIGPADVVILDRVINVSPEWRRLVDLAAERAQRFLGLVYPRDTRAVRGVVAAMNAMLRLLGKPVRASVRPYHEIERITRHHGLSPRFSEPVGRAWYVTVFARE
jgi:magnesium-protoporphyrin O-methyltransferase